MSDKGLWMGFIVLNCQVVEWGDIFANPSFQKSSYKYDNNSNNNNNNNNNSTVSSWKFSLGPLLE